MNMPCHKCGVPDIGDDYPYMLHDELWQSLGVPIKSFMCIGCVESILGRQLIPSDFKPDAPINWPWDDFFNRSDL